MVYPHQGGTQCLVTAYPRYTVPRHGVPGGGNTSQGGNVFRRHRRKVSPGCWRPLVAGRRTYSGCARAERSRRRIGWRRDATQRSGIPAECVARLLVAGRRTYSECARAERSRRRIGWSQLAGLGVFGYGRRLVIRSHLQLAASRWPPAAGNQQLYVAAP